MSAPASHYSVNVILTTSGASTNIQGTAFTADTYSNDIAGVDRFSAADVFIGVGTLSGTLNVYVQKLLPGRPTTAGGSYSLTDWADVISFTQFTAANDERLASMVTAGNAEFAVQRGALAAGTIRTTTLGRMWRVLFDIGGASATCTLSTAAITFYA